MEDESRNSQLSTNDSFSNEMMTNKSNSYCTDCQEELNELNKEQVLEMSQVSSTSNNFDNNFLTDIDQIIEPIGEATRSLSKISLDEVYHQHNEQPDNQKCLSNNNLKKIYIIDTNNEVVVEDEIVIELIEYNSEFYAKQGQLNSDKIFCDKEIQTELQFNENNDLWELDFPHESELRKIDETIINSSIIEIQKEKLHEQNNKNITEKSKKIAQPNYNSMSSILLNRRKRLAHLSNDIYQLSSYLNDIRRALTAKEPLPKTIIPSPPPITGYDSQFDFPNEKRFGKLPITIESINRSTDKSYSGSGNSIRSGQSLCSRFELPNISKKRLNNGRNESVSKRFMKTSYANKENRINEKKKMN